MKRQKYNKNKQVLFYYDSFRINVPKVWTHCKIEDLRQEADTSRNSSIVDYDSDFEWWFYSTFFHPPLSVNSSSSSSSSVWSSGQDDTDDFDDIVFFIKKYVFYFLHFF